MLRKAIKLLWEDIKNMKTAIFVIAVYLGFMELVLHNGCPFVVLTGFPCPACGLTRAGLHLLKGEWIQAWNLNFMIFPIAVIVIVAVIYRYFLNKSVVFLKKYVAAVIIVMVTYYIYRMFAEFPGEAPMSYYYGNLFRKLVEWIRMC